MSNIDKLNTLIEYIEENLTEDLDYKELAKMLYVDEYTLFRVFSFITGVSLAEYIRKRRLTKAGIELRETDIKVIDVAVKYGYDSSISFSRAFKKMYGINPSDIKEKDIVLNSFSKIKVMSSYTQVEDLEYKILEQEAFDLYGVYTESELENISNVANSFWNELRSDKEKYTNILKGKTYGILEFNNIISKMGHEGNVKYYIAKDEEFNDSIKISIPKSNWAVFKLNSREAQDIHNFILNIYENWIPNSGYNIQEYPEIEVYKDDGVEWWLPVKYISK